MTTENPQENRPGLGNRLGQAFLNILRLCVRVLVILSVIALLGLAFFYGVPYINQQIVQPLEENRLRLDELEAGQGQVNEHVTQALGSMQDKLATLDARSTADAQLITHLQARLDELESSLKLQVGDAQSNTTSALDRLDKIDASLVDLGLEISQLSSGVDDNQAGLQALSTQVSQEDPALSALRREVCIVKAMELVTRARLFLGQSNFGLARQDVQAARQILADLASSIPDFQVEALSAILVRLDLVLSNLPAAPVIASDDLEVAWQLLVLGLPGEPTEFTPLPITPTITVTVTPTLTVTIPVTETIGTTVTPSPTSSSTPQP